MHSLKHIRSENDNAVIRAYAVALRDGAHEKALAIREANPDLVVAFDSIDRGAR